MPVFLEDPSEFSKERLKSELIAHNVALPPGENKKQEYLELYLKNVDTKNAADFSSDEEEELPVSVDSEQRAEEPDMRDLSRLTDEDLKAYLRQHGFQAGPITATTRYVYEKKLKRLMEPKSQAQKNGSEDKAVYSDSEEEENEEEQEQPDPSLETVTCVEKEIANSKMETHSMADYHWYPQCFMPPARLVKRPKKSAEPTSSAPSTFSVTELVEKIERRRSSIAEPEPEWENSWNRERRPESCGRRPLQMLDKLTMTNTSLLDTSPMSTFRHQMVPVTDVLMEIFPETEKTPTGIVATRRRPIKGAAGRPVKFKYPDTPLSPKTTGQQEVQRHKFPIWVQLLCFLIVTLLLLVTYLATEDTLKSSLTLLLDNLNEVLAAPSVEDAPLIADAAVPLLSGE
ncbi:LEM domain-containing protein 1 isoform X2 [Clupea harengus]|uniref:LEM domain-containing protein 1 isoform X2 n=1 Tax=Clupea harengus TaxID=7950 RepID=A0A6P3W630_CLUHA|nr:LEM domain-containing protein 1 isoform X2 [Clupea harengus]